MFFRKEEAWFSSKTMINSSSRPSLFVGQRSSFLVVSPLSTSEELVPPPRPFENDQPLHLRPRRLPFTLLALQRGYVLL